MVCFGRDFSFFLEHWVGLVAKKTPQFYSRCIWAPRTIGSAARIILGRIKVGNNTHFRMGIFGRSEFVPKEMVGEQKRQLFFVGI